MRIACCITKASDTHSEYVIRIVFRGKNGYANAPQRHVTPTLSPPKYANDRRSLDRPRQSMYILNSDQPAGHYCNTLQHCEGFRSLLTALQSVGRNFFTTKWRQSTRDTLRVWWWHWPKSTTQYRQLKKHENCGCAVG